MRLVVAILSLAGLIVFSMVVVLLTSIEDTFYIVTSIVIAVLGIFFAVMYRYHMPKADQAIVRTGGKKYVVHFQGGGVWINTIFHELRPISLNTMRLEITRVGKEESLITSDFMRADVTAVFYVKVPPEEDSVIKAAQTLGQKTIPVAQLRGLFRIGRRKTVKPGQRDVEQDVMLENIKNLLEDKVDGALRSVAATMELEELQKERQEFAEQVKTIVTPDLKENGLLLETVTITMLNQTPVTEMDPNNRFDAVGIKEITGIIKAAAVEKEKKVKEADVAITGIDVKAAKQKFTLEQDRSWAEADMQMKIATYSAEKEAETIKIVYEQEVVGQRAGIIKDQELQKVEINKTKEVEIAKAEQEQKVNERIIEKNLVVEIKNIEMGQKVAEREILRNLEVGLKQIDQEQKIGVKDFEKQLAITKAKIAQEEGIGVREIEKMLAIAVNRVAQEQKVLEREIEKNKFVEIAAIEMSQKIAEKEIERNLIIQKVGFQAQVGIKEAEVNSLKAQYVLEKDRVFAEADKEKAIQAYSATRKAEGAKIQYEQEVISEVAKIAKDQAVSVRDIEKTKNIEIAGIEKTQKVQERDIEKNLMIQRATYGAQLGIKEAEVSSLKQQYILEKDRAIVDADQKKIVQAYSATRKAEGTKVQYEQEAFIEVARIGKDQTVMVKEIDKNRVVEVAGIEMGQKIQEREIERNLVIQKVTYGAQLGIKEAEVSSLKQQYILEKDRAVVDADQKKIVQAYSATRKAEGTKVQYEQEAVAEVSRIAKDQTVSVRDIEKTKNIEIAGIEKTQKVQERDIEKNLMIQRATYGAQLGIKEAEVSSLKQQYILEKDRAIVDADQKKIVQAYSATRKAEGTKVQYEQEAFIEVARIGKDQTVMVKEIDKNRVVEVAGIEMGQKIQEREIERNLVIQKVTYGAQLGIKEAEVSSLKQQYILEKDRAVVDADQKKIVQAYSATRKAEGTKVQYEQEAVAEVSRIAKDQTVSVRDIEKTKNIEIAGIEKTQKVQERDIEKNLMIQRATYGAQLGIKEAEVSSLKQQYILEKDRAIVDADQKKIVQAYSATRKAEGTKVQYEQEAFIEVARIGKDQTVMVKEIDKNRVVEVAGIEMGQKIQEREIERNLVIQKVTYGAQLGIKEAEVSSLKQQYILEKDRAVVDADQKKIVQAYSATRKAEGTKVQYEQEAVAEVSRIAKDQTVSVRDIEKTKNIEIAGIEKTQKVQERDIEKNLMIQRATYGAQLGIKEAEVSSLKQQYILEKDRAIVDADQKKIVQAYSATRKAEGTKVQYEQEAFIEVARIGKDQTVMVKEIDKNRVVEVAGIEMGQKIQEREIERNLVIQRATYGAQLGIKEAEVSSLKQQYILEKDRAVVDADQKKIVQAYSATRKAEGTKVQYEQEAVAEVSRIAKDQTVSVRDIEKTKNIEIAGIEKTQKVQERDIEKNLMIQRATYGAQLGIKEAEVSSLKQQYILEKDRAIVDADQKKIVQAYSATRKAEGTKVQYEQEAFIEVARIGKDQTVMVKEIDKNRVVEVAGIEMGQKIQEREIERNLVIQKVTYGAQLGIKEAEVSSLKQQYILEKDRAVVDADQKKIVQAYSATRKAEGTKVQYEQEAVAEVSRIAKDQTVSVRDIEKTKNIEIAGIEKTQKVQERDIEKNLMIQRATYGAQLGIKEAEVSSLKQQYILEKDRAIVDADQKKIVQAYSATRKAEGTKVQYEQEAFIEVARIGKDQTVMVKEIDKNRVVEVAGIEMGQKIQEREIERNLVIQKVTYGAQLGIKEAEVSSLKQQYILEKDRAVVDADQKKIVQAYSATRKAEGTKVQYEQEAVAEVSRIAKDQTVSVRDIEKTKNIEIAGIEKTQKVQERDIEKNLMIQRATYGAQLGIKEAEVSSLKQQYILEKDRAIVDADQKKIVQAYSATRKAEGTKVQYEQEAFIEVARIGKDQTVMVKEIDKNRVVEVAGIEMGQKIQEREIERNLVIQKVTYGAQLGIKEAEVSSLKQQYILEKDRAVVDADQKKIVQAYSATRKAEGTKVQYEQEAVAEVSRIAKDQTVSVRDIEKTKNIEIAGIEKTQKVQERDIEKNLMIQRATYGAQLGIKEAEVSSLKQQYILEKDRAIVDADQKKIVQAYSATRKAEGTKVQYEQEAFIEVARIGKDQTVMVKEIDKNRVVEVAGIEMGQKIQEREIERNLVIQKVTYGAQLGIKEAEVSSLKQQYILEKDRAVVDADQKKIVQAYSATRKAEGTKVQYEQEAVAEVSRIAKDQTVSVRDIEKTKNIEIAGIEKTQKVQERDIEKNLMIQRATYGAQLGIKEAEVSSLKQQYILEKDRAIVDADQKKIVQAYSATRKAEGTKVQYEQEAVVEKSRIAKEQTIMERDIERGRIIEIAQISMGQAVQIREIERNLEVQKSVFSANVGIKRSDVDSQIKQFALEQDRSYAESDQRKRIIAYVAQRQAEAAQIIYDQDVIKEVARISKEQRILERDIDRGLAIELRQINMGQVVGQADISQRLIIGLTDEDRKISMELKMKQTDLASKEHLEATALKNTADINAITVQRIGEAERDKEIAIIGAEREAKPMERLAEAILAQAKAKAEGQMKMIEAKNVTEQRILVQQAILQLIDSAPQIIERMMKPVEKIESIRILNMGDQPSTGIGKSSMGKLATNLMDTGAVMPMVKEFLKFADINADDLAKKASEYISGLIKVQPK